MLGSIKVSPSRVGDCSLNDLHVRKRMVKGKEPYPKKRSQKYAADLAPRHSHSRMPGLRANLGSLLHMGVCQESDRSRA